MLLLLGAESNGKALLISMVTDDLTKTFKAGNIVKTAAGIVGGGGRRAAGHGPGRRHQT